MHIPSLPAYPTSDGGTGPHTTQYPHSRYLISESNVIKPRGKLWIYYLFIPRNGLSKCFSCFSSLPTGSPYVFRAGLVILPSLPEHSPHLCSSWGQSLRWIPESLFLNQGLWGRRLASRGINQVLTTCQPLHLQQGARLVTTQPAEYRGTKESTACGPKAAAPGVYLPPSCRRACALASARAPSFPSSCCRWCCPFSVHLDSCGHTLAVRSGRPRHQECILEEPKKCQKEKRIKTNSTCINNEETKSESKSICQQNIYKEKYLS